MEIVSGYRTYSHSDKNNSASSINTTLWHYLGTKHLDFRRENNGIPGVLIKEIWYAGLLCGLVGKMGQQV